MKLILTVGAVLLLKHIGNNPANVVVIPGAAISACILLKLAFYGIDLLNAKQKN